MKIQIIGNGVSGLLLGLGFASTGHNVTILSRPGKSFDDTPLILPELVINFFEEIAPGLTKELEDAGAKTLHHSSIIAEKFNLQRVEDLPDDRKLRLSSRELLISCLIRRAGKMGIEFRSETVTDLTSTHEADFVFDCTGSPHARKNWMTDSEKMTTLGEKENFHLRSFYSEKKTILKLGTAGKTRGGIYPVEGNRFFLCMSSPATDQRKIDVIARELIGNLNASAVIANSRPESDWMRMEIQNTYSEYYLSNPINNFFPVGDGVLFSNPVYGRGISLLAIQLLPLMRILKKNKTLTNEEIHSHLKEGFLKSFIKWKEVSRDTSQWYLAPLRKFYLERLAKDPAAYELILKFYQLEITPEKLILGIIRRSVKPYLPGGRN